MKKLAVLVSIILTCLALFAQWGGANQGMMTPQDVDLILAQLPRENVDAAILGYWQDVIAAAVSGDMFRQQIVASYAEVIRKYDSQYNEHLQAAMQAAAMMVTPSPVQIPQPMPFVGPGGGGRFDYYHGIGAGSGISGIGVSDICPICHGSGSCTICHGTGTYSNYGYSSPCDTKCSACGGTGRR